MAFDGYESVYIDTPSGARVFSYLRHGNPRVPGRPGLMLLHGYPQSSLMWKDFVKGIPSKWDVLVPDLPGYGQSTKPVGLDSRGHSKREWAKDIIHVVNSLWGEQKPIIAYGHDRGARLSYRLALDFPTRVVGAGLLDIVPTSYVWNSMNLENKHDETKRSHHWIFLSSPRPLPETMITSNPEFYFQYTILGWVGKRSQDLAKKSEWVRESIAPYLDARHGKDRIMAACEDYRAGATFDVDDDFESGITPKLSNLPRFPPRSSSTNSPPFACPLLVLSSIHLRSRFDVDEIWKSLGTPESVDSFQIGDGGTGHFLVNEAEGETLERTTEWLDKHWPEE